MTAFSDQRLQINGIDTLVQTAGEGEPLVHFHGAGTVTGFDALLPLAQRHRLVVPHHPGFGGSADDPRIDSIHDYVRHYLDLLDALEIGEFSLVGHSMGGLMAAWFGIEHRERVRRLVLIAPLGLKVPEHPTVDLFTIRDQDLAGYLTERPELVGARVPDPMTAEFLADRYRESTSAARVLWSRPRDLKLAAWLHRLTMPTLLLWGEADRLIPAGQATTWAKLLPDATVQLIPGCGHLLPDESPPAVQAIADFVGPG